LAVATIRLLGGLEVAIGDRRVALPTRKAEALLARLARRPGDAVARARLAGLLWPDRPDEQGRASLRQALASIRRAFVDAGAPDPIAGGDAVALVPEAVEVDAARLDRALLAGGPGDALAGARGPLLEGFPPVADPFDDWLDGERAALARRLLDAIRARLDAERDPGALLALADAGLAIDPAFEDGWRARMRALALRGDAAAALGEYGRCREALQRAVGGAPGPATEALRASIAAPAPAAARPRGPPALAVLPFEVLSGDAAHEPFARGLEEDVVAALTRFRSLRVLARASSTADALAVAAAANADYLLAGNVRAAAGRLRVGARLVEADTGAQLWADRFEGDLADVFGLQDRVARAVVSALALRIDEHELADALRRPPTSLEAYGCWLRGMEHVRRGSTDADLEARRLFERALAIDPAYARGWSGLSLSFFNDWSCAAWERWDENARRAQEHAERATRLDDRDHVGQLVLGRILLYRREFARAEEHLARALALNPNDPDLLAHAALGFALLGDAARALAAAAEARALHPFHPDWYFPCFALGHFVARDPPAELDLLARAPDRMVDTRAFMAAARARLGDLAGARAEAARYLETFARKIVRAPAFAPDAPARWVLHVNPFRRGEDRAQLAAALARAGLALPPGAAEGSDVGWEG
jgi:TolB-like protein